MEYGSHVWVNDLVQPIHQRLVDSVSGLTADRVFLSLYGDDFHLGWPDADRFVTTYFPDFRVDQPDVSGGGIYNTAFDSTLVTTAFVRLDADPESRSAQQLTDLTAGVYRFIQQVIAALQDWPDRGEAGSTGSDGLQIFRRPMRVAPGFRVERKAHGDRSRWAVAPISWEVSFVANLGYSFAGTAISM